MKIALNYPNPIQIASRYSLRKQFCFVVARKKSCLNFFSSFVPRATFMMKIQTEEENMLSLK